MQRCGGVAQVQKGRAGWDAKAVPTCGRACRTGAPVAPTIAGGLGHVVPSAAAVLGAKPIAGGWCELLAPRRETLQPRRGKMANRLISTGGTASARGSTLFLAAGGRPLDTQSTAARGAASQSRPRSNDRSGGRLRLTPPSVTMCRWGRMSIAGTSLAWAFMGRRHSDDGWVTSDAACLIRVGWANDFSWILPMILSRHLAFRLEDRLGERAFP